MEIISKLSAETMPSTEILEYLFSERMKELLRSGKLIVACDVSVKNVVRAHWVMTKREKKEVMNHEMYAKYRGFSASKIAEVVVMLYLITTLRKNMEP